MIDVDLRLNQMELHPHLFARTRDGLIAQVALLLDVAGHPEPDKIYTVFGSEAEDECTGGWGAEDIVEYARGLLEEVPAPKPEVVGQEIKRLLLTLRHPGHTLDDEKTGWGNYSTDALRAQALDHAGICWFSPGELAPGCACPWTPEDPSRPRLAYEEDFRRLLRRSDALARGLFLLKTWIAERSKYQSDPTVSVGRYGEACTKLEEWATPEIDTQEQELKAKNNKNR